MIILRTWRASIPSVPGGAIASLVATVQTDLHPLVLPARIEQARILGVTPDTLKPRVASEAFELGLRPGVIEGEVFTDGKAFFVVDVSNSSNRRTLNRQARARVEGEQPTLSIYYIGAGVEHSLQQKFVSAVEDAFKVSVDLYTFQSARFQELKAEGRLSPSANDTAEVEAARVLAAPYVRSLAIAIKSSGGLLVRDLSKQLPADAREQIDELRNSLTSNSLVDTEIVIVCRKTQAQVARVPNRDILRSLSGQGVKCACGRPITDESVEEALSITDLGRNLLDGVMHFAPALRHA